MDADAAKTLVAALALIISLVSLVLAQMANKRSIKSAEVRALLDEKEPVAFGALKLLRDGLPKKMRDRKLVIAAVIQGCVFEGSDRARALLFRVIERNPQFKTEFSNALSTVSDSFESMTRYQFSKEQLDLATGYLRIKATRKVLRVLPTVPVRSPRNLSTRLRLFGARSPTSPPISRAEPEVQRAKDPIHE